MIQSTNAGCHKHLQTLEQMRLMSHLSKVSKVEAARGLQNQNMKTGHLACKSNPRMCVNTNLQRRIILNVECRLSQILMCGSRGRGGQFIVNI